ncbi:MAG: 50S ribosomal protein L4, partial [Acidimicrobiia bacterium]|nr:50S ribosomal protein L4 [Acidimicrobiia bacterium]
KGEVSLDVSVFGLVPNIHVMHQVVTAQMAGARSGSASTKTRAEVRGGGRKPWRQKGLGRARHGSIRAPQWTGGGVAFGPKPRDYSQRTPKKMKKLALRGALSARASESEIKIIDAFDWAEPKTKLATALLEAVGAGRKILVVIGSSELVAERSFRNLPNVLTCDAGHVTTYDVLWAETIIFTSETLGSITGLGKFDVADDDFVKESSNSKSSKTMEKSSASASDSPESASSPSAKTLEQSSAVATDSPSNSIDDEESTEASADGDEVSDEGGEG